MTPSRRVVKAGKASVLELRFKVRDGYHVNSHTPKSDLLIPTAITLQPADGVKAAEVVYPAGTSYSFSFDPKEKLNVYTGEFVVKLPVVAAAGSTRLRARCAIRRAIRQLVIRRRRWRCR